MGILVNRGIASNDNATTDIFENLFPGQDFTQIQYNTPKDYVAAYWNAYTHCPAYLAKVNAGKPVGVTNGKIFEYIIYTLLIREGIVPFYTQANVTFVPAIDFDTILYKEENGKHVPYCLSLKTSLRERWKQADLEGEALKNVHRKAKCYLLTIESNEAQSIKNKILNGDAIGIDECIDCNTDDINRLIASLKTSTYRRSIQVDVVTGKVVL